MTEVTKKRIEVGERSKAIAALEARHMAPGLQSFALYAGLAMARGEGSRIFDEDGNGYIDFIAGIAVGSVGHCHPHYVKALQEQAGKLTFGSFTTEVRAKFLNLLGSVTPEGLSRVQLFSGGAEAVEAAFRLAKSVTKKHEFVGYSGAFHGKTGGVLPLLWGDFKNGLGPFVPGTYSAPYAYCYRCPLNLTYPDCGIACAEKTRDVIKNQSGGDIAAIIVEPVQGTAGNVIPPPGFLPAVRAIAKDHGALFIADEMITGFGRTGKFWGVDHDGVVPDVMTCGKGIGGGFPLAAVVSTDELTKAKPFANPSGSSSSYGGNPLASAAGLAALEIIIGENLVANSEKVGAAMLRRLQAMQEKHRVIGDVRGKGLLLGIELVKDRHTKELVSKDFTKALFQECLRRGLVAMVYAPIIRLNPPLNISEATALEGLEILDEALGAVAGEWKLA
ncbi:MAG TPA: aspartate aminotransferase family protein [Thermoanaerobaculia bacterium]|jgi:4-aminobutyrate aminotransferase/(S)-3-amino-2-methylpropionate transaminase|nr:aspartate aminotransferase family protein [Thermoanaerobaculia bacterium]